MPRPLLDKVREERGMTVIMVAIFLPVLVLLTGLAVDSALWWVHKRHLQTQADAAAFAGATEFRHPCDSGRSTLIERTALDYSGAADIEENDGWWPKHNKQVGRPRGDDQHSQLTTANVGAPIHARINEGTFWEDRPPAEGPDVTDDQASPCGAKFLDVKLTEERTPGFFARLFIDHIDAQARVEMKGVGSASGVLPIGVEEVNPSDVHAWLFDEATGTPLGDAELEDAQDGGGLLRFDNNGSAITVSAIATRRIGVTLALSGSDEEIEAGDDFAATCARPLVACYGTPTQGVSRIRAYREESSGAHVQEMVLSERDCTNTAADRNNGYFSTECSKVDVTVDVRGVAANSELELTYPGANRDEPLVRQGTSTIYTATLPLALGRGRRSITVQQKNGAIGGVDCTNANECEIEADAHASFSGSRALTGPIKHVQVNTITPSALTTNDNNVRQCPVVEGDVCPSFVVQVGLEGRLELNDPKGPPLALRIFHGGNTEGAESQQLDCDFEGNPPPGVREEYAKGCRREYTKNAGANKMDCPKSTADLPPAPEKLPCVPVQPGADVDKPRDGLRMRILCLPDNSAGNCPPPKDDVPNVCTNPNAWNEGQFQFGDPRLVPVFLVPFGSFAKSTGTGSYTLPVIGFATFYVTAWDDTNRNPCRTTDNPTSVQKGEIWGYYAQAHLPGATGEGECAFGTVNACVAVLTK